MKYIAVDLGPDHDHINLYNICDTHFGSPEFMDMALFDFRAKLLDDPHAFCVLGGDLHDAAIADSVGDTYEATMNSNDARKYARKTFLPLAEQHKILALTDGNHEQRIKRDTSLDLSELLAEALFDERSKMPHHENRELPYDSESIYLKIRFGQRATNGKRQVYTVYLTHGTGGGRTAGGKANKLSWMAEIVLADIYLMGHMHTKFVTTDNYFVPDLRNDKLDLIRRTYIITGAWLEYGGYGERKMYKPTDIGAQCIRLYADEKRVEVIT